MTIDELLAIAMGSVARANNFETNFQYGAAAANAAVAQAAAVTAQAKMLAQMTTTGENVTTGETVRWLRVDTGN